jgi:hypothetical protein
MRTCECRQTCKNRRLTGLRVEAKMPRNFDPKTRLVFGSKPQCQGISTRRHAWSSGRSHNAKESPPGDPYSSIRKVLGQPGNPVHTCMVPEGKNVRVHKSEPKRCNRTPPGQESYITRATEITNIGAKISSSANQTPFAMLHFLSLSAFLQQKSTFFACGYSV